MVAIIVVAGAVVAGDEREASLSSKAPINRESCQVDSQSDLYTQEHDERVAKEKMLMSRVGQGDEVGSRLHGPCG